MDLSQLKNIFRYLPSTLIKGRSYYRSGKVRDIRKLSLSGNTVYEAKIKGTSLYSTKIYLSKSGTYSDCSCTCPFFIKHEEPCKHIAALYLYLQDSSQFKETVQSAEDEFLQVLLDRSEAVKRLHFNLDYVLEYKREYALDRWLISMKAGIDKMYMVKDVKDFIKLYLTNGKMEFGKKFTYDGQSYSLSEESRKAFNFLIQLYQTELLMDEDSEKLQASIFSGKHIRLNENLFLKFIKLIGNSKFELIYNETVLGSEITVEYNSTPFCIDFLDTGSKLSVQLGNYDSKNIILSSTDRIVYSDSKLYILDDNTRVYKLFSSFIQRNLRSIDYSETNRENLIASLPELYGNDAVRISENLSNKFIEEELDAQLYIDKYKKGISLHIEFKYGNETINPFDRNLHSPFIVRNRAREAQIMNIIEDAEFKINGSIVYLDDYDSMYKFFSESVPNLTQLSTIFYTDKVKGLYAGKLNNTRVSLRSSMHSDFFNLDVDLGGISHNEALDILIALKYRKKYHKLKDGSILSLEGGEAEKLSSLLQKIDKTSLFEDGAMINNYTAYSIFGLEESRNYYNVENMDVIQDFIEKASHPENLDIQLPDNFEGILRNYQVTGYKWMKTLSQIGLCGILADDMGLGKTLQAITLLLSEKGESTSIVVAPSSLIYNWESEFKRFAPELKVSVISGTKNNREEMLQYISQYDVIITSYPLIRRDVNHYMEYEFNCCIIDEAQHIKNPDSINAQSIKQIKAKHRFALTGTPIENSLSELWSIFDFLMPGYLKDRSSFVTDYEKPLLKSEDRTAAKELRRLISPFILRRKKKDVLVELPDKIETKLLCELNDEQRKLYNSYLLSIREQIGRAIESEGFEKNRFQILSMLTRLRQICCHPSVFVENYEGTSGKMDVLEELIDELVAGNHRILLFSQFTALLELIKRSLDEKGIKYLYLDGSTEVYNRLQLVERFNGGEGSIFLISLKAGGTGLNLASADTVIHFDPWWNPAVEDQATDRAHRIGQKNVVEVFKLITKDTIEEKIFALQQKKRELINEVIHEDETFITSMSKDEILGLFS